METIGVCLRMRPVMQEKPVFILKNSRSVHLNPELVRQVQIQYKSAQQQNYEFNECFDQSQTNLDVFNQQVRSLVLSSIEGINSTLFVYGQTGAGKTFTMLGAKRDQLTKKNTKELKSFVQQSFQNQEFNDIGVLIYSLMELFKEINRDNQRQYELICSYCEVYNENVHDLLREQTEVSETLQVISISQNEFIVKNLKEISVFSLEEVIQLIHQGESNRHYAETILNHQSSRSHTIFRIQVNASQLSAQGDQGLKSSTQAYINFIDLAGSEKIGNQSHNLPVDESCKKISKDRFKESQSINKSLFFLTRVIAMKTSRLPPQHIPYRNSTLTKIMKSSISGNFRTLIILCITPSLDQFEQSQSTLRFGISAKLVENKVDANLQYSLQENNPEYMMKLYLKVKDQENTIKVQREQIEKITTQNSQISQDKVQQETIENQLLAQQQKNKILEKNSQEMYDKIVTQNEEILDYYHSHKELEVRSLSHIKQLINQLKDQNQRLQSFAKQALLRIEMYENESNLIDIPHDSLRLAESQLKQSLLKIKVTKKQIYIYIFNQLEIERRGSSSSKSPPNTKSLSSSFKQETLFLKNCSEENLKEISKEIIMKEIQDKEISSPFSETPSDITIPFTLNQMDQIFQQVDIAIDKQYYYVKQKRNKPLDDQNKKALSPNAKIVRKQTQTYYKPSKSPLIKTVKNTVRPISPVAINKVEPKRNVRVYSPPKQVQKEKSKSPLKDKSKEQTKSIQQDIHSLANKLFNLTEKLQFKQQHSVILETESDHSESSIKSLVR